MAEEVVSLLPAFVFFCGLFFLLWLTKMSVLREHHLHASPPSRVLVGAIIVAKGLLLVDLIPVLRRLDGRSVLVGAFWRTWCYFAVVFFFQYVDLLFERRHEGWTAANRDFLLALADPAFWVLQLWVLLSLFGFSTTQGLVRKLGRARARELLIGR